MASTPVNLAALLPSVAAPAAYNLINQTFVQKSAPDPINGNLVEIGDSKQPNFYPQVKIMRWGNEVNFSARLIDLDGSTPDLKVSGNKIQYIKSGYEVHYYDMGFEDDTGGFVDEIILNSKPSTNIIQWTIQSKGLVFNPQGPLTTEEIADGAIRPDNVVGSIAVYHETNKNHKIGGKNYRAGKAFHIYALYATDTKNNISKATLDIAGGNMTATLDQTFLDSAVYPVSIK